MLIAIEGCCHGELDKIYETLDLIQKDHGKKVDLLICCGDFQAVRNVFDLSCMAVPPKYLSMQTFHKYYTGEKQASVLTIFIGGNHEASNYLQELSYGGWVAPNIFYLGNAGVVSFGGLRIAGISGIYKGHDYMKGHHEVPPYTEDSKRSIYHVRQLEVFRLKQISRPLDIFVSHDWPNGVTDHGDAQGLLRFKPYLREEIEKGQLGNPATWDLMQKLRPRYWFSAHMHAKFTATVKHTGDNAGETKFLALDKCLPGKRFLQVLDIASLSGDAAGEMDLSFDPEWMGILRDTNHLWHFDATIHYLPGPGGQEKHDFNQTEEDIEKTKDVFEGNLKIDPGTFQRIAPAHESTFGDGAMQAILREMKQKDFPVPPVKAYINSQTTWLCEKLGVTDPLAELIKTRKISYEKPEVVTTSASVVENPNENAVDESVDEKPVLGEKPENGVTEDIGEQTKDSAGEVNGASKLDEPSAETEESISSVDDANGQNESSEPASKKLKSSDEMES